MPSRLIIFVLGVCSALANARLPYSPTKLFLSTQDKGKTYTLFRLDPPSSATPQGALRSAPIEDLNADNIAYTTTFPSLPFLMTDPQRPYQANINSNGIIKAFAGDCTNGSQSSKLWEWTSSGTLLSSPAQWTQSEPDSQSASADATSQFLADSISFSPTTLEEDDSVYLFGGMCPQQSSSDATWVTDATYSNQLVQLSRKIAGGQYTSMLLSNTGQPIPEAGFTMTPLVPAIANSSNGAVTQHQNFLLMGGHTQTAFLNMSQVALFSLPEASWTFLPINSAGPESSEVEPRSGHTAVLSSDGTRVIVVGGWVGNISTPAEPQLAVLEIGQGYGGSASSWTWLSDAGQQTPFQEGSGVYGHGAVMLPGNIMMVSGGYSISSVPSKSRRDEDASSQETWFYNVSSGALISKYNFHLAISAPALAPQQASGPLTTTSQKTGLGLGLSLGVVAVALACLFGWLYWRKLKNARQSQEYMAQYNRAFRPQNTDTAADDPMQEKYGESQQTTRLDGSGEKGEGYRQLQTTWEQARTADRTGLDLNLPSPSRGLRKGRSPRTSLMPDALEDHAKRKISPIDERPERDDEKSLLSRRASVQDPFRDPDDEEQYTSGHQPQQIRMKPFQLPTGREDQDRNQINGQPTSATTAQRYDVADSDRTKSSISEQSLAYSEGYETNPFVSPPTSPTISPYRSEYMATSTEATPEHGSAGRLTEHFRGDIIAESERLLGRTVKLGQPPKLKTLHSKSSFSSSPISPDTRPTFTVPSARAASRSKLGSWVGSVRRGLSSHSTGYPRSASMSSVSAANYLSNNYHNPTGGFVDADQYVEDTTIYGSRSAGTSPTKPSGPRSKIRRKQVPVAPAAKEDARPAPRRVMSDSSDRVSRTRSRGAWDASEDAGHTQRVEDNAQLQGVSARDKADRRVGLIRSSASPEPQSPVRDTGKVHEAAGKGLDSGRPATASPSRRPLCVVNKGGSDRSSDNEDENDDASRIGVSRTRPVVATGRVGQQVQQLERLQGLERAGAVSPVSISSGRGSGRSSNR